MKATHTNQAAGTGTLIQHNDTQAVLSAAHVFKNATNLCFLLFDPHSKTAKAFQITAWEKAKEADIALGFLDQHVDFITPLTLDTTNFHDLSDTFPAIFVGYSATRGTYDNSFRGHYTTSSFSALPMAGNLHVKKTQSFFSQQSFAKVCDLTHGTYDHLDIAPCRGDSGGPLLTIHNEPPKVIGISTSGYKDMKEFTFDGICPLYKGFSNTYVRALFENIDHYLPSRFRPRFRSFTQKTFNLPDFSVRLGVEFCSVSENLDFIEKAIKKRAN